MRSNDGDLRGGNVPVLDGSVLEELRQYSSGTQDLAEELITLFLNDSPAQLATLQQALRTGNRDAIERTSHRLKGSAGSIGARRFQQMCEAIETAARDGSQPPAEITESEITAELELLQQTLLQVRKEAPQHRDGSHDENGQAA